MEMVPSGRRSVMVVAVAAAGLLISQRGHDTATTPGATVTRGEAATWTLGPHPGEGQWTGLEWHDITASAGGIFIDRAPWLEGSRMDEVVSWRGGFALVGGDDRLWTSKDGMTWTRASWALDIGRRRHLAEGADSTQLLLGRMREGRVRRAGC